MLKINDRQITEMIDKNVEYSRVEVLDGLVEYAKSKCGSIFSRGDDIFPVLDIKTENRGIILTCLVLHNFAAFAHRSF